MRTHRVKRPAPFSAWTVLGLAVLVTLGVSPVARAAVVARVNDSGGFFSIEAVSRADAKIREIRREFGKDLLIETLPKIPDNLQGRYKELGKDRFFAEWAERRAEEARAVGVYVLLCRDPSRLQVEVGKPTRVSAFTLSDRDRLAQRMLSLLKAKKNDQALAEAVDFVATTLSKNHARPAATPLQGRSLRATPPPAKPAGAESSMLRWIVIAVGVFGGVWLLMAVMRAMSGGMGGGAGSMGGAGVGGGGGGGFFTSLLGGLFGAAVGNWMYDSFFRGSGGGWGASDAYGADPSTGNESAGEDFGDDTGGGGDFGDGDSGGGDFGGGDSGGGDFGGGDFGGGDFGGGDFGGGDFGGGDFGGGDF
jgi:uncharacterized protein